MAPLHYSRTYHRFPLHYPVIFGGAPFVGEGLLTNLSLIGCSVLCDREVLCGSDVRVSVLLPNQTAALSIDLGTIKWVQGHQFEDRKSTRLNSSHIQKSRMPSSA